MALTAAEKAQKAFKQEEMRREGAKNLAEYRQAQADEQKKTERLRALRLAQEAKDAEQAEIESAATALDKGGRKQKKAPARKVSRRTH